MSDTYEKITDYREEIEEIRETIDKLNVKAPFSGKITALTTSEGKTAGKDSALATLTDESVMELTQYASYAYLDRVYIGMSCDVSVSGHLATYSGTVTEADYIEWISPEGMKCFGVTVQLSNPGVLTLGLNVSAALNASDGFKLYPTKTGTLSYKNSEEILAPASGEVLSVNIKQYSVVNEGDLLFTISAENYYDQIESIEKQITSANKQLESYQKQIDNLLAKIEAANEKIAGLYDDIAEAEESREDYSMRSEISGKVM